MPRAEDFETCRTFYRRCGSTSTILKEIECLAVQIRELQQQHLHKDGELSAFGHALKGNLVINNRLALFMGLLKAHCFTAARTQAVLLLFTYRKLVQQHTTSSDQ